MGSCPIPSHCGDSDNDSAFTIDEENGVWSCWTHNCHEQYGRDIIGLVRTYYNCNFYDACSFIESFIGDGDFALSVSHEHDVLKDMMLRLRQSRIYPVPEDKLSKLEYHSYLIRRGFSTEVIHKYEIGFYPGDPSRDKWSAMRNRIIFPIRHIDNSLVGYTGRTLIDNKDEMKRRGITKWWHSKDIDENQHFPKSLTLYNAHNAKKYINKNAIILVEGPLDVLKLEMAGIHIGCAVFGVDVSRAQERLIRQMGARTIVPLFDSDVAGNKCCEKLLKRFPTNNLINIKNVVLPDNKDPGDLSVHQLKEILHEFV